MPTLEEAVGTELSQGDILKGVTLYETGDNDDSPLTKGDPFCLVITRNCKSLRAKLIVVAPIVQLSLDDVQRIFAAESVEMLAKILATLRDGGSGSDQVYLGSDHRFGTDLRYCAKLDRLYTIQVPTEPGQRAQWVGQRRIAKLSAEQRRDLHIRLLNSMAREGFDDDSWMCTADLEKLLEQATQEQLLTKKMYDAAQAEHIHNDKASSKSRDNVAKLKTTWEAKCVETARYQAEVDRRRTDP